MLEGLSSGFFRDVEFRKIVERDLTCGVHGNPTNEPAYFATAYFHRSDELATEVADAGFVDARILAIEGPVWSAALFREAWNDAAQRESLMNFLSLVESTFPAGRQRSSHGSGLPHGAVEPLPSTMGI